MKVLNLNVFTIPNTSFAQNHTFKSGIAMIVIMRAFVFHEPSFCPVVKGSKINSGHVVFLIL